MKEITKEELEELYINQNLSSTDIAKILGCGKTWAGKLIKKHGLIKDKSTRMKRTLAKMAKTNIERYGSVSPFGNQDIREKAQDTLNRKYGTHLTTQLNLTLEQRELINNKDSMEKFLKSFSSPPTLYEILDKVGITHCALNKRIKDYNLTHLVNYFPKESTYEKEVKDILTSWGINYIKDRTILEGQEIDIYCPEYQIGIEFNGNHWHSVPQKGNQYHQNKSMKAEEKGIFLYHIFEYEWVEKREQILNQLRNLFNKNETKIGARETLIKDVTSKESRNFLQANHLQGADNSKIKYGLYYNEELVALMTFCKPRFNKEYEYELSRFCCKANVTIPGGASRLFNHFIKTHNPKSIISYSDISHTKGNLYAKLGFSLSKISRPNYIWIKGLKHLTRYQCQRYKLIELYPEYQNLSESEIMTRLGYEKLEDSGNKVWTIQF